MQDGVYASLERAFDEIFSIEIILNCIQEICSSKELLCEYYDSDKIINISRERNMYVQLTGDAISRLEKLKEISKQIGKKAYVLEKNSNNCRR